MFGPRRRVLLPALVLALAPAALVAAPTPAAAGAPKAGVLGGAVTAPLPSAETAAAVTSGRTATRRTHNRTTYRSVGPSTPPPAVQLAAWAVADLDTGHLLAVHRQHARRQPASTIKLLTSLTAARRLPARPQHRVTWAEAHPQFCVCVGLRVGRRYPRDALVAAMLLPSGNDAAEATAGADGRGRSGFLRAMNRRAARLGMTGTRAVNPSGLTASGASTTARDLLVLLRAAQADPVVAPLLGRRTAPFGPIGNLVRTVTRSNPYVDQFPRAEGKTGFTTAAGYNLVVAHPIRGADGVTRRIGAAGLGAQSREANTTSVNSLARWVAANRLSLRPLGRLPDAPGPVLGPQARWASTSSRP